jgi:ABC-type dipeptide/oligopeptide/nickel transport system ATPase component
VGCSFAPRCALVTDQCRTNKPMITKEIHAVECWNA